MCNQYLKLDLARLTAATILCVTQPADRCAWRLWWQAASVDIQVVADHHLACVRASDFFQKGFFRIGTNQRLTRMGLAPLVVGRTTEIGGDVLLPRPAAICLRFVATFGDTKAAVSFAHTHVVTVNAPYIVTAIASIHFVRQNMVLSDESDDSAARATKWWHESPC